VEKMVRVMATGVFDLLHLGHIHYLEEAKKLGDELVVVVATDKTARERKHETITPQDMRLAMIRSLKPVDRAVLGKEGDIYEIVKEIKPDIIALGFDQVHDSDKIARDLKDRGIDARIVRLPEFDHDLSGSRKIMKKVIDWYIVQEKLKKVEEK
jgi:FAD synthetase